MSLGELLKRIDNSKFSPRTLEIYIPDDIGEMLSVEARWFFLYALNVNTFEGLGILDFLNAKWKDEVEVTKKFFELKEDVRIEILAFLTVFIHEYTHRVDFLSSPFGLHYYTNTIREYWCFQEFFPRALDDKTIIEKLSFLVTFGEKLDNKNTLETQWQEIWDQELGYLLYNFNAWGDGGDVKPIKKFIKEGWREDQPLYEIDVFEVGLPLEQITLFGFFQTLRIPGKDKLSYFRPLTILETKAVANSLLYILDLFKEKGVCDCASFYKKLYADREKEMLFDYFFLFDLVAKKFGANTFSELLDKGDFYKIFVALNFLSAACWYALQAPPLKNGEDPKGSNPILRFCIGFKYIDAFIRGKLSTNATNFAQLFLDLDEDPFSKKFSQKNIQDSLSICKEFVDSFIKVNRQKTWNPEMRSHFDHILTLIQNHLNDREQSYTSFMGMPSNGNPLSGCRTKNDWEITYDDYSAPEEVKDWLSLRTDLLFGMLKPSEATINRIDAHFKAYYIFYYCKHCQNFQTKWVTRFLKEHHITCFDCGNVKVINIEDSTIIKMPKNKE